MRLHVPDALQRNGAKVRAAGIESTGEAILRVIAQRAGVPDLAELDVLDVGCGVRFAQTIVNRGLAVRSYTGIEVEPALIDFLDANVAAHDDRFRFAFWNVRNALYNPGGIPLADAAGWQPLGPFDLIVAYSVFTHLDPCDAAVMLRLLRARSRPRGRLFFTAFIDDAVSTHESRAPQHPLMRVVYGRGYMDGAIAAAGWRVDGFYPGESDRALQPHYICSAV